jgi:inhibitor of cysteine peptidase
VARSLRRRSRVAPYLMAGFWLLALMLPAAPVQAAPAALTLTEKDSGRLVTLKVGETLVLNLRNPGSGGYQVLPPVYDGKVLTLLSRRDLPPTQSRPGDFGRIELAWQARQAGDTEVTVNIARPWEKHKSPEQFLKIRARVEN